MRATMTILLCVALAAAGCEGEPGESRGSLGEGPCGPDGLAMLAADEELAADCEVLTDGDYVISPEMALVRACEWGAGDGATHVRVRPVPGHPDWQAVLTAACPE